MWGLVDSRTSFMPVSRTWAVSPIASPLRFILHLGSSPPSENQPRPAGRRCTCRVSVTFYLWFYLSGTSLSRIFITMFCFGVFYNCWNDACSGVPTRYTPHMTLLLAHIVSAIHASFRRFTVPHDASLDHVSTLCVAHPLRAFCSPKL